MQSSPKIERLDVSVYTVPTETPESDGTLQWDKTSLVLVEVVAGGEKGMGYSYADIATAQLIDQLLAPKLTGRDALAIGGAWQDMVKTIRNLGRPGIASMAIAAVDNALWDLKGKLLNISVAGLLGMVRPRIMAYGSGGFTSYSDSKLREQLGGWAEAGFLAVKMKIGRDAVTDIDRVRAAREAIGAKVQLFVDANGAYSRKQALDQARRFREAGVTWFEEPVSSDDLEGLRLIRDQGPAGMDIAAGEYGYDAWYFRRMLGAGAVDVLQADATRCAGITGFLQADALCESCSMPLSAHTAPSIHAHACCGAQRAINVEYFYDHARIESMAFDGALEVTRGFLTPDVSRPGFGLALKEADMQQYRVYGARRQA
ncbi:MAG TPA: enolase C-terminal domain-like protein [Terriglobia bacterium]|nr:enolase C-terminal domain-like protein [Terriglobia bacterium]